MIKLNPNAGITGLRHISLTQKSLKQLQYEQIRGPKI